MKNHADNFHHCRHCEHRLIVSPLLTCTLAAGRNCRELASEDACHLDRFSLPSPMPYRPTMSPPSVAVPRTLWPLAARIIAKLASETDRGVGDTLARIIDPLGGAAYKRWYRRIAGAPCGCTDRQAWLNVRYPYAK